MLIIMGKINMVINRIVLFQIHLSNLHKTIKMNGILIVKIVYKISIQWINKDIKGIIKTIEWIIIKVKMTIQMSRLIIITAIVHIIID